MPSVPSAVYPACRVSSTSVVGVPPSGYGRAAWICSWWSSFCYSGRKTLPKSRDPIPKLSCILGNFLAVLRPFYSPLRCSVLQSCLPVPINRRFVHRHLPYGQWGPFCLLISCLLSQRFCSTIHFSSVTPAVASSTWRTSPPTTSLTSPLSFNLTHNHPTNFTFSFPHTSTYSIYNNWISSLLQFYVRGETQKRFALQVRDNPQHHHRSNHHHTTSL